MLGPGLRCVLAANGSDKAEFRRVSEHLGCNIRTAWVVTEIFGEQFFAPIRRREARLDRYLRYGEIPDPSISPVFDAQKAPCTSGYLYSWTKYCRGTGKARFSVESRRTHL